MPVSRLAKKPVSSIDIVFGMNSSMTGPNGAFSVKIGMRKSSGREHGVGERGAAIHGADVPAAAADVDAVELHRVLAQLAAGDLRDLDLEHDLLGAGDLQSG